MVHIETSARACPVCCGAIPVCLTRGRPRRYCSESCAQAGRASLDRQRYRGDRAARSAEQQWQSVLRSRAWRAAHPEQVRVHHQQWRRRHSQELRLYSRRRYAQKRAHIRALQRAWRLRDPERTRAMKRAWRLKNPEKCRAMSREQWRKHREKRRAAARRWWANNLARARDTQFEKRLRVLPDKVADMRRTLRRLKQWCKANDCTLSDLMGRAQASVHRPALR